MIILEVLQTQAQYSETCFTGLSLESFSRAKTVQVLPLIFQKEIQMFAATSDKEFPLKGYSLPLSPKGQTSIVDAPPWYYGGEVLCLTFEADERKVRALIPPPLEMGPNPGQGAVWFVEWVSASEARPDLAFINPERSLYRECFVVVGC